MLKPNTGEKLSFMDHLEALRVAVPQAHTGDTRTGNTEPAWGMSVCRLEWPGPWENVNMGIKKCI